MLRGVNKRMIEITETGNDAFERVFVVLREGLDSRTAEALGEEAGRYARELARSHRNRRQEATLPFVSPRPAPAGRARSRPPFGGKPAGAGASGWRFWPFRCWFWPPPSPD